jgi:hypothetical protein
VCASVLFSVDEHVRKVYVFCRDIVVPKSTVKTEESKSEDDDDDVFYDTEDDPDDADEDLNDSIV